MAYSLAAHCPLVSTKANNQMMYVIWKKLKAEKYWTLDSESHYLHSNQILR